MRDSFQSYEEWLRDNPAPELSELLETFGEYAAIPDEALQAFAERTRRWNVRRIRRHW